MLAVLVGAALMGPGAWFALKKYEARLTDRIRSDVESKMLSPPERPPRTTPRRDYDDYDTVRNLPLPLAPTAPSTWHPPMRPPGFDAYSRATRSAGPYVYSRAPPATPHSSRSRRSPLVAPYTPPSRRSAKVAPTPTSPLEAELSELRSRLEAVEAPIVAEVAELRARLDFVEALSTQGGLTFCVSWEEVAPYELKPGKMHVQVCYATDLIAADNNGLSDPYCKLTWLGQKGRTKIVPKTLNPEWDESFIFTGLQP